MAKEPRTADLAWPLFDKIVADASTQKLYSQPWVLDEANKPVYKPDYVTLEKLLGVPLFLKAMTQSGIPALAIDVWLSYELRRAGFDEDQVWPRPTVPRVLPAAVANLMSELPRDLSNRVKDFIERRGTVKGVTSSAGKILGKNYVKQVDVIVSDWSTGPEVLISTKRMDSSYGNNAANRVEESYGDAKNLRQRHPLAALGFLLALRSDIFLPKDIAKAEWLIDLLGKLGQEDDAYHATCLLVMDYSDEVAVPEDPEDIASGQRALPGEEPGPSDVDSESDEPTTSNLALSDIERLPKVSIEHHRIPEVLTPAHFLANMVTRVLSTSPIDMHKEARRRRSQAVREI